MTLRLTTTLTNFVAAEFSPGADFNVQCDATDARVIVDVYARLDAASAHTIIDSFQPAAQPIERYVSFPYVKFGVRGNQAGTTVNVWTA